MSIVVCGSFAYDTVMVFDDKFNLERTSQGDLLDEYFIVPDLRRNYGGCAGNIAYNLRLLDKHPVPVSSVGMDFAPYAARLDYLGVDQSHIKQIDHSYTAQTFINLDAEGNRVTAFHPGAMTFAHLNIVPYDIQSSLAVIAPDSLEGMKIHARQLTEAEIPFLFYPGPTLHQMDGDDVMEFIAEARWISVHQNDLPHLLEQVRLTVEQLSERVDGVVLCRGVEGAQIHAHGVVYEIPPQANTGFRDEGGCEDAFCAGLLYGLDNELDWETTGHIAALAWTEASEHHGSQNHHFTFEAFKTRFLDVFGYALIA